MKPKAGDKVKVVTSVKTFEGTLLPRPKLLSEDITVLKLSTGYNVGIESKKIKKVELVESFKSSVKKSHKLKPDKDLPTVAILSTGGTISSRVDYRTGGVYADYTADDFVAMCPELLGMANIETMQVMELMSEDLCASDWVKMADAVKEILPKVDGVVLTHGTDTMHFTASALSFLLKDLGKPVILVGAQRSIDRGSSDAFMNLICAVIAASKWDGAGVVTCMHGTMDDSFCDIVRGTKVRKMHTSRRDAFRAINDEPLAHVFPDGRIEVTNENHSKRSDIKTSVRKLDASVALVYVYPNVDPGIFDYHVKRGVKGFVVAGTALGHVPTEGKLSLIPVLKRLKVPVFMTSQTLYGSVHAFAYSNLRKVSLEAGVIYLDGVLPETAYAKLMVALTEKDPVKFMLADVAGEFTVRELDDCFLR